MRRFRAGRLLGLSLLMLWGAVSLVAQTPAPAGEWSFTAASGLPSLTLTSDGGFRWGGASGRIREERPTFAQGTMRYFTGLTHGGVGIVLGVLGDRVVLYRASGEVLADGVRAAANPLGITWAGAGGTATAAPPPAAPPSGSNPLGVSWAGGAAPSTPPEAAPTPPAGGNPLGVSWAGSAPSPATPPPPTSGANPLGIAWAGGGSSGGESSPPSPAPAPPAGGNPLGITWAGGGGTTSTPPAAPTLSRLELSPGSISLAPGEVVQFRVTGVYSDGSRREVQVRFTGSGGSLQDSGRYTAGTEPGAYTVVAQHAASGVTGTATVGITRPARTLVRVWLSPSKAFTPVNGPPNTYRLYGMFSDSTFQVLPAVFRVSGGGTMSATGEFRPGGATGTFTVVARHEASGLTAQAEQIIHTGSAPVTVTPGVCRDPWVTEVITRLVGRAPQGSGESGECDIRRYNQGRWNSKAELERYVRQVFQLGPVRGLYVIDGTASDSTHLNALRQFYERWQGGRKKYWNGVTDVALAKDVPAIYQAAREHVCHEVRNEGVEQVFLAGYSRGAFIAVAVANWARANCGAQVQFLGLVDAVDTSMEHFDPAPGIPFMVHYRKDVFLDLEHVLTTAPVRGVPEIRGPYGVYHHALVCDEGDANKRHWQTTMETLVEHARRAGGAFGPRTRDRTKC